MKGFPAWPGRVSATSERIQRAGTNAFSSICRLLSRPISLDNFRRPQGLSASTFSAHTISKLACNVLELCSQQSFQHSGWIEDSNINPYMEHKEQMLKLGKPKASFNKAIKEIDAFMKDPAVSCVISGPPHHLKFHFFML